MSATTTPATVAGGEPGQRHLNGPQTTGRDYRNLSTPEHPITRVDNVAVLMLCTTACPAPASSPRSCR